MVVLHGYGTRDVSLSDDTMAEIRRTQRACGTLNRSGFRDVPGLKVI